MDAAKPIDLVKGYSPYFLAEAIGSGVPDSLESPGAKFLCDVRDAVVEALEQGELDEGRIHEIADSAPDVYDYGRWQEFVDLAGWQEDVDDFLMPLESPADLAGVALYQIAHRLATWVAEELS